MKGLTPVLSRRGGPRRSSCRFGLEAKVDIHAALAPNVAANIQETRIKIGEVDTVGWSRSARNLESESRLVGSPDAQANWRNTYYWPTNGVLEWTRV